MYFFTFERDLLDPPCRKHVVVERGFFFFNGAAQINNHFINHCKCAASCIFDPLPSCLNHCTKPPEHRWPDSTARRINHLLRCIIVITDWHASLSIRDLETSADISHRSFHSICTCATLYLFGNSTRLSSIV